MFKTWGDLSWREKCAIRNGSVNSLSYQSGFSFDVKAKVAEGKRKREEHETSSDDRSTSDSV